MKKLNFDHQTYQTSHTAEHKRFAPLPLVVNAMRHIGASGTFGVPAGFIVEVRPYMKNVALFTISRGGTPLVRCFACYKKQPAQAAADWNGICDELRLLEGTAIVQRFYVPSCPTPPSGPFLLIALLPGIISCGADMAGMLGDLERCLYWHLHRYYQ